MEDELNDTVTRRHVDCRTFNLIPKSTVRQTQVFVVGISS